MSPCDNTTVLIPRLLLFLYNFKHRKLVFSRPLFCKVFLKLYLKFVEKSHFAYERHKYLEDFVLSVQDTITIFWNTNFLKLTRGSKISFLNQVVSIIVFLIISPTTMIRDISLVTADNLNKVHLINKNPK